MKIIEKGTVQPPVFWWIGKRFSCKGCGCVFEMTEGDYHSDSERFTLPCPTCKATLRIRRPVEATTSEQKAVFDEIFGAGGLFEGIFGKPK